MVKNINSKWASHCRISLYTKDQYQIRILEFIKSKKNEKYYHK